MSEKLICDTCEGWVEVIAIVEGANIVKCPEDNCDGVLSEAPEGWGSCSYCGESEEECGCNTDDTERFYR